MGKINILDIDTVNKISAGEVVERPASAIKEMIENSIDAGANKITVEIKNGGVSFMRVTDNGGGIERDDIEKAFLPHSTSKITKIEDLSELYTMGFRGEALASISSVSKVELITKTKNEECGTAAILEGGKFISKDDAGCPDGTTIVVSELFYNTPARMKFLKKDSTEGAHIADVVDKMILGNPGVSIKFINNGRVVRMSPGNGDVCDAFACVFGRDIVNDCIKINYEYQGVKVTGLVGQPFASRPNRSMQVFFVNKRAVRSKTICFAAEQAYETMLMNGKYPILLIYVELNASHTDVNVHPSKLEVKFSNEKIIHDAVFWGVQNAIFSSQEVKEVKYSEKKTVTGIKSTYSDYNFKNDVSSVNAVQKETSTIINENPVSNVDIKPEELFSKDVIEFFKPIELQNAPKTTTCEKIETPMKFSDSAVEYVEEENYYKIIGQIFESYIIVEQNNKMLLIDQHAAHERINFNKLSANKQIDSQVLLSSEMVTVTDLEADTILSNIDIYEKLGFEIENFGDNKLIVRQAPCDVDVEFIESAIHEIADIILKGSEPEQLWDKALFSVACKSAIKANTRLGDKELEHLVNIVLNDDKVKTCPHGRPVVISFDKKFIEKEFKRIL
ncbi:MAG: DNA mismatch repair endonuclease MutL [Clostridia bacterium]|nr:DNA mismatch repair endonuclease MutL [Clostridia bacterium]